MFYNVSVYSTGKIAIGVACVAAISLSSIACTANPAPPILEPWEDTVKHKGIEAGLDDIQQLTKRQLEELSQLSSEAATKEELRVMYSDKGCVAYFARSTDLSNNPVTLITVKTHGLPLTYSAWPEGDSFMQDLKSHGC